MDDEEEEEEEDGEEGEREEGNDVEVCSAMAWVALLGHTAFCFTFDSSFKFQLQ